MTDPRRYLDDPNASAESRSMLESAAIDGLDPARMAAVAQGLGLRTDSASVAPRGTALWMMGGAALVAVCAVTFLATRGGEPKSASPGAVVIEAAPITTLVLPSATAVSVSELPDVPSARASAPVSPRINDDLPAQLRALEDVRRALAEHRPADAREGLMAYDRTFPKKRLATEARVLDIETLVAEHRTEDAQAKARAFLVAAPDSPYATRVRSLVAEHDAE